MNTNIAGNDLVTWTNDLSVDIEEVDNQHKYLVERINWLWKALLEKRDREVVLDIIEDLYSYTQTHFIAEEVLMRSFDYPDFAAHQLSHRKFVEHIRNAADDYAKGKEISMDLLHFLNNWLQKHIKVSDRDYASYIDRKKHGQILGGFRSLFKKFNAVATGDGHSHEELGLQGLDMQKAIALHMDWNKRLATLLSGEGLVIDAEEAVQSDLCMLGNWINVNAEKGMDKLDEFKVLQENHREFHLCAANIITLYLEGSKKDAGRLLKGDLRQLSNSIRFDIIQLYAAYHRKFP